MPRYPGRGFVAFDPASDVSVRKRNLPHWFQKEVAVFLTFRTADSLPREVVLRMQRELREWLLAKGLPREWEDIADENKWSPSSYPLRNVNPESMRQFRKLKSQLLQRSLDHCHGACHLKRGDLRQHVAESILYHNGSKHELDCFVVMPNHVHAIVQFGGDSDFNLVGQSWMRFSARKINESLGLKGPFWQAEPFDHLIRSEEQFRYLRDYIRTNPRRANLPLGEWLLWDRGKK
ncbi:MAG: transposase [Planctomycetota bacterium]